MGYLKNTLLTTGMLLGVSVPAFSQVEIIERLPDSAYVANWRPVYRNMIVSYVQLPGDSAEYKKMKLYVQYLPKPGITREEEQLKQEDLGKRRYLGAILLRTGRRFAKLLDDSVLGLENINLRIEDLLFNKESFSAR